MTTRTTRLLLAGACLGLAALWALAPGASGAELPGVQATVERECAGCTITTIKDGDVDGTEAYEIQGVSTAGVELQIAVGRDGRLLQKEEALGKEDLPPNIVIAIHREIGNAEPENIRRITRTGTHVYRLQSQLQDESVDLTLTPGGVVLEEERHPYAEEEDDDQGEVVPPPQWDPDAEPGSDGLPLQYLGPELPDGEAADGRLLYSPGVQNLQLSRANRKYPPPLHDDPENHIGWTYQHHVGIGSWKGKLYAVWDMTHVGEDNPPCHLVYSTSDDGFNWTPPRDLYPYNTAYNLRFYFYRASNDRMLVFAAGHYPTDNISESRKDRLYVREISADHQLGEIYTLIKPAPGHPPAYTESTDPGFLQACREAIANKPLLEQGDYGLLLGERKMKWHYDEAWPGGKRARFSQLWQFGKSLCFYTRKDGVMVATCKMGFVNLSRDGGETWSQPFIPRGIRGGGGKLWAQGTPDGRYAMIYIPQSEHRYPMAVTTSDDGITFRDMRVIHGEVPPQRYTGRARGIGPQYLRGISEWGSDGSREEEDSIWTIYSMSKEDIWISRVPVPIVAETGEHVEDTFEENDTGARVPGWNTYSPIWAPVAIAADGANHYLGLEDREPIDYARAIRTFPQSPKVEVSFRLAAEQVDRGRLEVDLLGERGRRPVRLALNDRGRIEVIDGRDEPRQAFAPGLEGTYFSRPDLTRPDQTHDLLDSVNKVWGRSRGGDWSARWKGFLDAPHTGEVTFSADAADGLRLIIDGTVVIDGLADDGSREGRVEMTRGKRTPVTVEFASRHGDAKLVLSWSWPGQVQVVVADSALTHPLEPRIEPRDLASYAAGQWLSVGLSADCRSGEYTLTVDGRDVVSGAGVAEPCSMVYAVSFRTGEYRGEPRGDADEDIPNSEDPVERTAYRIDDVKTSE